MSVCAKDGVKFQNRTVQTRSYLSGLICTGKHEVEKARYQNWQVRGQEKFWKVESVESVVKFRERENFTTVLSNWSGRIMRLHARILRRRLCKMIGQ